MTSLKETIEIDVDQPAEQVDFVEYDFLLSRRRFVQVLGAGLLVSVGINHAEAQAPREPGGGDKRVSARGSTSAPTAGSPS